MVSYAFLPSSHTTCIIYTLFSPKKVLNYQSGKVVSNSGILYAREKCYCEISMENNNFPCNQYFLHIFNFFK